MIPYSELRLELKEGTDVDKILGDKEDVPFKTIHPRKMKKQHVFPDIIDTLTNVPNKDKDKICDSICIIL